MSGGWGAAAEVGLGLYQSESNRQDQKGYNRDLQASSLNAQKKMIADWVRGYALSQGEFRSAEQDILAREQQGYGGLTAGLAGSGLLNTTAGANMGRGIQADTNRSLTNLASTKAGSTYDKWMDLAEIHSNATSTKTKGVPLDPAQKYLDFFDYAGVDWGNFLFGQSKGGETKGIDKAGPWGPVGNTSYG